MSERKKVQNKMSNKMAVVFNKTVFFIFIFLADIFLTLFEISPISGVTEDFSGFVDMFCVTLDVRKEKNTYAINKQ